MRNQYARVTNSCAIAVLSFCWPWLAGAVDHIHQDGDATLAGTDSTLADLRDELATDRQSLQEALDQYAWDDTDGLYGYVVHDERGYPTGVWREADSNNSNLGLDGLNPLYGGWLPPERAQRLIQRLLDPERHVTSVGISTVDHDALLSPRWILNGACGCRISGLCGRPMDYGRGDDAWRIARIALDAWSTEVAISGCSFEHLHIASQRGAGWHQFGGLSTPIMVWYATYTKPGTLTGGAMCGSCQLMRQHPTNKTQPANNRVAMVTTNQWSSQRLGRRGDLPRTGCDAAVHVER